MATSTPPAALEKPPPDSPELKVLGLFLLTPTSLLAPHSNSPKRPDPEPSQIPKRQIPVRIYWT